MSVERIQTLSLKVKKKCNSYIPMYRMLSAFHLIRQLLFTVNNEGRVNNNATFSKIKFKIFKNYIFLEAIFTVLVENINPFHLICELSF